MPKLTSTEWTIGGHESRTTSLNELTERNTL